MAHVFALLGIAVVLFASTNIDDIFVLLAFFADPRIRTRQIVIGQYLGIAALYGASVAASLASLVIPAAYIGLLGFVPICLGLKKLWEWRTNADGDDDAAEIPASTGYGNIGAVAAVTIANGADNISIYTPLFATLTIVDIALVGIVFTAMTAAWLWAAYFLANHPRTGAPIRRYGVRLVPFVLVALGLYILHEAGSWALVL